MENVIIWKWIEEDQEKREVLWIMFQWAFAYTRIVFPFGTCMHVQIYALLFFLCL